jgi:regulator of sigma E protease
LDQPNTPDHPDHLKPGGPPRSDIVRAATDGVAPRPGRDPDAELGPAPAPPLTPGGWLMSNGPYLLVMLAFSVWLYRAHGLDGLVRAGMVVLGLGFVIFIHELGHFLTAKWCDVHVQTFSIGFGPALPGCSFTRGETTYKLAVLPLGGYVNMVGEGPEADEDEDYPRSFKNKTVGQRMLIISAGVIMNVLFGALCFIVVYLSKGVERPPAVVSTIESGSRAWEQGVRPTWKIVRINRKKNPWFDDMRVAVALSGKGEVLEFEFKDRDGNTFVKQIEPLRDENNLMPVIGVTHAQRLKLTPAQYRKVHSLPVLYNSPAAKARVLELNKGDQVLAVGAAKGKGTKLSSGPEGWAELCKRLSEAKDEPLWLQVRRAGASGSEWLEVPAVGFDFGDEILGTTDPRTPDEPFNVTPLPPDPTAEPDKPAGDPFAFRHRLADLAGKPMVIQVRRDGAAESSPGVNILVPPAFHKRLGLRMKMGRVARIREGSPAAKAGLEPGDIITGVTLVYDKTAKPLQGEALDPVRLPYELNKRIHADASRDVKKWRVILTVARTDKHDAGGKQTLPPMEWDDSWDSSSEAPVSAASPMSIPQLGVAYHVDSTVVKVFPRSPPAKAGLLQLAAYSPSFESLFPRSPAAKAGLQGGDEIREISVREAGKTPDEEKWSRWVKMFSRRGQEKPYDQWAHYFWGLQRSDFAEVKVKVARGGQDLSQEFGPIEATDDPTWPLASRGLILQSDTRLQRAHTFWEAVTFGLDWTTRFIKQIYLNLSSLLTGRLSTKTLGGPVEIASQAFSFAGEDLYVFALFLGMISINLAVVNFLPIPVLDGGHMVFLIYEKLRGRPPSEMVRAVATYVGLLLIASLMLFVFYQDFKRRGWLPSWM